MAILRKLPAAVAVAALTVLLAGCGSSDVRDERDEARMERDAAQAAAEAAAAEAAAAEQARMEAEAAAEQAEMDAAERVEQAEMDAAERVEQAEMDAAERVEQAEMDAAEAEEARMAAEAERDRLAQEEAQRADQMAAQDAAMEEATSRALYAALANKSQLMSMPVTGGTATLPMNAASVMANNKSISWDENNPLTATDATDDTVLRRTMTEASMMGSWTGAEYKRELTRMERVTTDVAMVYTNQAEPTVTGEPFGVKHRGLLVDAPLAYVDNAALITTSAVRVLIASPEFAAVSGTKTHPSNQGTVGTDAAGTVLEDDRFFETRGTLDGAPGIYTCHPTNVDTCISTVQGGTAGTEILLGGGVWTFIPDVGAMTSTSTPDATYYVYGWWLRNSDAEGYQVGTFTDVVSDTPLDATDFPVLEGKATYMGHAAGKYSLLPGLANPTGDAGHFTANVMLKAEWGDNTVNGTLEGMVDGFMGADGMARDWTVELKKTGLNTTGATDADVSTADAIDTMETIWTINGVEADEAGMWMGTLHEASPDSSPRAGTPTTAVGEFTAQHGVVGTQDTAFGSMAGAFGAELQ